MKSNLTTWLGAAALAVGMTGSAVSAQELTLQMTTPWPQGLNLIHLDEYFVETLNKIGGDDLQIEFFAGGTLVPATQTFDAVRSNSIAASATWPGYWGGTDSSFSLMAGFPMFFANSDYLLWINEYGGQELMDEIFSEYGLKYIPHGLYSMESGIRSNGPLTSLADLEGKRIRMSGRPHGAILAEIGAAQINLSGGEVYQALERGVVDAAEFSVPSTDISLGFQEVTDNWMTPGWHQPGSVTGIMINLDVWNGMTDHQRALIETAAQASMVWSIGYFERTSAEATIQFQEAGIQVNQLSDDDLKKLQELSNAILLKESCDNPKYAKLAASQIEFMQAYAPWREMQGDFAMGRNMTSLPDLEKIKACAN